MVDDYILDKLIEKIKEIIGAEKFDDSKILIKTYDKLPGNITFKNVVILIACVMKDDNKFYLQIFLEQPSVSQNWCEVVKVVKKLAKIW